MAINLVWIKTEETPDQATYAVRSLPETPDNDKILVIDKRAAPETLGADLEDRSLRLAMGHLLLEHRKTRQWPRMGQHHS